MFYSINWIIPRGKLRINNAHTSSVWISFVWFYFELIALHASRYFYTLREEN